MVFFRLLGSDFCDFYSDIIRVIVFDCLRDFHKVMVLAFFYALFYLLILNALPRACGSEKRTVSMNPIFRKHKSTLLQYFLFEFVFWLAVSFAHYQKNCE